MRVRLLCVCARALSEIEAAEALVASGQKSPQGKISVTAPNDFGGFLARFLKDFCARYPKISVDLVLTNRYVNLISEGVDIALRAGVLKDSTLRARKVATTKRALFASPSYLLAKGSPNHPKEIEQHQCILFAHAKHDHWRLMSGKQRATVKTSGIVSADDIVAQKDLALHDLGIALLPTFICHQEIAAKKLVSVLPDWSSEVLPISIVYPAQKFQHPKIKAFIEEIAPLLTRTYGSFDRE